jgi:beta-glucosidase-like glycosyl hydrolase
VAAADALTDLDCLKESIFGLATTSALEIAVAGRGFSVLIDKVWGPVLDLGRMGFEGAVMGRGSKDGRLGLSM